MIAITCFAILTGCGTKEQFSDKRAYRTTEDLENYEYSIEYVDPFVVDQLSSSGIFADLRPDMQKAYSILNDKRKAQGHEELRWDQTLETYAFLRAYELAVKFSHTRPDGTEWFTTEGKLLRAENIYMGYGDPAKVMESWINNPADTDNFLSDEFTGCAISIFKDENNYYWVALFK